MKYDFRDDIIRMAREAGWDMDETVDGFSVRLERFAALVAAEERESCEEIVSLCCGSCAEAIRARGEE